VGKSRVNANQIQSLYQEDGKTCTGQVYPESVYGFLWQGSSSRALEDSVKLEPNMTPDRFLQKLVEVIGMIKAPAIIIIMAIALIQSVSSVFIGGQDKRALFSTIAGLMLMAALIFYVDKFVLWISTLVR
jgi:hypothetical protein